MLGRYRSGGLVSTTTTQKATPRAPRTSRSIGYGERVPVTLTPRRSPAPADDLIALLAGCHERIRRFSRLAVSVAEANATDAERAAAAAAVVRYFTLALPLHEQDEDHSVAPRLRGRDAALDAALDRVVADHTAHAAHLARVVATCDAIAADPRRHAALAPALRTDARTLVTAFDAHLAHEEAAIFPAIAALAATDRAAIRAELAARRA